MLGRIRKFSSSIYSKVFLFIVAIPFVFWGMGDLFSGGNQNTIVKIGKEKVHTQDFISYLRMKSLTTNELNDSQIIKQLLYSFIGERLILKEIDDLDLRLSDNSLAKLIKSQKLFEKDGKFSRTEYEKFLLQNNFNAVFFEQKIIYEEKRKQLFSFLSGGIMPSSFLINKMYDDVNQKRKIEYFNLENIIKNKYTFSEKEIKNYYDEKKENFSEIYKSFEYIKLDPNILSGTTEFNDSYFKKIDEIEDLVAQGKDLDFILKKFDLKNPKKISINITGESKSLEENKNFPKQLVQKVFEADEIEPTVLTEIENDFFIFEVKNTENIQKNLNDKNVKEEVIESLKAKTKRKFVVNLIDKINKNEFNKDSFDELVNKNKIEAKKIKIEGRNDNKILEEGIVNQIYGYGEKRVIVVTDIGLSEVFLVYINDIENVKINENSGDNEKYFTLSKDKIVNRLYNTYDTYLKNKYEININYKALDGIQNYIR